MHRQRQTHPQLSPQSSVKPDLPQRSHTHPHLKPSHHLRPPGTTLKARRLARVEVYVFLFCIALVLLDTTPFSCSRPALRRPLFSPFVKSFLKPSAPNRLITSSKRHVLSYTPLNFTLDDRPIRLISGSVHYFRIPPTRWRLTLLQARRMGLNAIETYVPWNLHEPEDGVFRFSGMLDLVRFLTLAHEVGLLVLLRPGPYICSEWDFGGLPPYLLAERAMQVRSTHPAFMRAVARYISIIARIVDPFVGRPVVALQIENEYGQYATDPAYMAHLRELWAQQGFTRDRVLLFTSDNGDAAVIADGSPFEGGEVLKTVNFGGHADAKLSALRSLQPSAPAMVMEFWVGWFDHWGSQHHTRNPARVSAILRAILFKHAASVNVYMFIGGTNFGFMAGANYDKKRGYQPDTTSYDYDAFVAESGALRTDKFEAARAVIRDLWVQLEDRRQIAIMDQRVPYAPTTSAYAGVVPLTSSIPLLSVLDEVSSNQIHSEYTRTLEEADGDYGYVLYRHRLEQPVEHAASMQLDGVRDVATVILDGHIAASIDRSQEEVPHRIEVPAGCRRVDVLVENRGRINYGPLIHDRKGLIGNITLDGAPLRSLDVYALSFPQDHSWLRDVRRRRAIDAVVSAMHGRHVHSPLGHPSSPPAFFHASLTIPPTARDSKTTDLPNTFCRVYGRGVLWINGFNVGRFNSAANGPQHSLFVPGALLREGANDVVVLHSNLFLVQDPPQVEFVDLSDFEAPQLKPGN